MPFAKRVFRLPAKIIVLVHCAACNSCLEADSRYEKVTCSRWPEGLLNASGIFTPAMARPSEIRKDLL